MTSLLILTLLVFSLMTPMPVEADSLNNQLYVHNVTDVVTVGSTYKLPTEITATYYYQKPFSGNPAEASVQYALFSKYISVKVKWNVKSFNTNKVGIYTTTGTIETNGRPVNYINGKNVKLTLRVCPKNTTYTGKDVIAKLNSTGFIIAGNFASYNIYGPEGMGVYDYVQVGRYIDDVDIRVFINNSNEESDKALKAALNIILPTQGNRLYKILDDPKLKPQTLSLENRKIEIRFEHYANGSCILLNFGPIVKLEPKKETKTKKK